MGESGGTISVAPSAPAADLTTSGTISANTSLALALTGQGAVTVQAINANLSGTLNFEESDDGGVTWNAVAVWPVGTTATGGVATSKVFVTDSTTTLWEGNVAGASNFRVRGSTVTGGSTAVTVRAGQSTSTLVLGGPIPTGANVIGNTGPAPSATGAKTNVASSASSVTILAANTARKGAVISNDSTQILYLDLTGGTASASSYSAALGAAVAGVPVFFELPASGTLYTGAITGIWVAANGNARVTEFS